MGHPLLESTARGEGAKKHQIIHRKWRAEQRDSALFEENAFLRAQQADPGLSRVAGPRHESVEIWHSVTSAAFFAGIYLLLAVMGRARGLSVKEWFDPTKQARPMQPLGDRMRSVAISAGLFLTGCGIGLMVVSIQALVWEAEPILPQLIPIYGSTFFGLAALALVIRDYRRAIYGAPSRQLTPEQIEPIRQAMEEFDVVTAVRCYRDAVPDAGLAEAREYAIRLAESLRPQNPGKYEMPPLSLATLNWRRMGICAAIEVIVLGVLWFAVPPTDPAATFWQVASSGLFAGGISLGLGVRGFWKRILLLAPSVIAWIVSEQYAPQLPDEPARSIIPYVLGFFVGSFLATSGLTRRRPKT
jgi:hypothetical protein